MDTCNPVLLKSLYLYAFIFHYSSFDWIILVFLPRLAKSIHAREIFTCIQMNAQGYVWAI
ncbi:hypothetical protein RSAG8_13881, partial [Rhizoctonia solani AG-8 WAC10335]